MDSVDSRQVPAVGTVNTVMIFEFIEDRKLLDQLSDCPPVK
jgi:hypothetical protein